MKVIKRKRKEIRKKGKQTFIFYFCNLGGGQKKFHVQVPIELREVIVTKLEEEKKTTREKVN